MENQTIPGQENGKAPVQRKCGTMSVHYRLLEQHPLFIANQINIEKRVSELKKFGLERLIPVTIPVVVHVIYKNPSENIADQQIFSQIDVLNEDYKALNVDISKIPTIWQNTTASAHISFALAQKDPAGNPTTGITRTQTTQDSFGDDDSVKFAVSGGADAWPADDYLNIWVCNLGGGLLGYAQFPGGPASTDGVVILNKAFGKGGITQAPFHLGRTATHEVGHYLNLLHIWGDTHQCQGTDFVADTPNAQNPNTGKPVFPHISCSNGPNGDMFVNYMDYVDDDSMVMFTAGQVTRMQATLSGARNLIGI